MGQAAAEDRIRQAVISAQAGEATAYEVLVALSTEYPNDVRLWICLAQLAPSDALREDYLQQVLRCDAGNAWALLRLDALAAARVAASSPVAEGATGDTEELQPSRIQEITNAPLPTPDPWQGDSDGAYRCPYCGQGLPGTLRCMRCGKPLVVLVQNKRLRAILDAVGLLLVFRSLMLVFSVLISNQAPTLPWSATRLALAVMLTLCAGLLRLGWRWVWWLTLLVITFDLLAPLGLLLSNNGALTSIRQVITTATVGLLTLNAHILLADRWRKALERITVPAGAHAPKTALDYMNAGVEFSRRDQWYLAARMWQRAVALRHHEHQFRRALGLAYLHVGEYRASQAELLAAATLEPDDAKTQALLATVARRLD